MKLLQTNKSHNNERLQKIFQKGWRNEFVTPILAGWGTSSGGDRILVGW